MNKLLENFNQEMDEHEPNFISDDVVTQAIKNRAKRFEDGKDRICGFVDQLWDQVKIRVEKIPEEAFKINKNQLTDDMQRLQILLSHIREDIFEFNKTLSKVKVYQHALALMISNELKTRTGSNIRTNKELESEIMADRHYNTIVIRIEELKSLIERSTSMSWSMNQQIGFVREVTKMETQRMYNG
jgi:hypothetical protein